MTRYSWLGYGAVIAAAAFGLRWFEYRYAARALTAEIYDAMDAADPTMDRSDQSEHWRSLGTATDQD